MDIRGGAYSRAQVLQLFTCSDEEHLIWDCLVDTHWAEYVVYDIFCSSVKRASPEPYPNQLTIQNATLIVNSPVASTTYGFTSKTYTDVQAGDIGQILCDLKYDNSAGGDVKMEVSVDGGLNYTIIVDTSAAIDLRTQEVTLADVGNDIIIKLEVTTDASANGAILNYCSVIF